VPEAGNAIRKQSQGEKSWYFWHPKIYPVCDSQRDPRVGRIFWRILPCWWGPGPAGPGARSFVRARNARAVVGPGRPRAPSTPRLPCSSCSLALLFFAHKTFKAAAALLPSLLLRERVPDRCLLACNLLLCSALISVWFSLLLVTFCFVCLPHCRAFFFASAYYPLVAVSWGLWQGFWGWSNLAFIHGGFVSSKEIPPFSSFDFLLAVGSCLHTLSWGPLKKVSGICLLFSFLVLRFALIQRSVSV
jgi:hypothetical protein